MVLALHHANELNYENVIAGLMQKYQSASNIKELIARRHFDELIRIFNEILIHINQILSLFAESPT